MPNYFADECVAVLVIEGLRQHGLDVVDAKQICAGEDDDRVLALANGSGRVLITNDRGFGESAVRHAVPCAGVIVLSLHALSAGAREAMAVKKIVEIGEGALANLSIIEPGRIRQRPLGGSP